MYKVCFADDEIMNHQLLEKLVDWEEKGFEIAGTATDGVEALQMYETVKPDFLFLDIRMPMMDGLECARLIRKEDPDIKIVIVSAYGDFTYAQKAIRYGVQDFLVKPVSRIILNQLVDKIKADLDEKQQEDQKGIWNRSALELQYLNIRKDLLSRKKLWEENEYRLFFEKIHCAAYFRCFDENGEYLNSSRTKKFEKRLVQELDGEKEVCYLLRVEKNGRIMLLLDEPFFSEEKKEKFERLAISENIDICAVDTTDQGECLCAFFEHFCEKENPGFYSESGKVYWSAQIPFMEEWPDFALEVKRLKQFAETGDKVLGYQITENILLGAEKYHLDPSVLKSKLMDMLVLLKLLLKECYLEESFYMLRNIAAEEFMELDKMQALKRHLFSIFDLLCERIQDTKKEEDHGTVIVRRANQYAENHFWENRFSVQEVAEEIGISKNYFVSLYKEKMQLGFWDFVTDLRMEKAKKLLVSTDDTAGTIARMVGYESEYHFSRKFKELVGTTPSRYRKSEQKAKNRNKR